MNQVTEMTLGPEFSSEWWEKNQPAGSCQYCGGQCDGHLGCGTHAAGCSFGGWGLKYWIIAAGCPLFHGEQK